MNVLPPYFQFSSEVCSPICFSVVVGVVVGFFFGGVVGVEGGGRRAGSGDE